MNIQPVSQLSFDFLTRSHDHRLAVATQNSAEATGNPLVEAKREGRGR